MLKTIGILCAVTFASATAMAQTAPVPPTGPTSVQCKDGWKEGMQWTKAQFEAACMKIREGEKR
jgi:hypothetical protein